MKDLAFGGTATAIEIFPSHRNLVDGENQRHLWLVDELVVPNLLTGALVKDDLIVCENCHEAFYTQIVMLGPTLTEDLYAKIVANNVIIGNPSVLSKDSYVCTKCGYLKLNKE